MFQVTIVLSLLVVLVACSSASSKTRTLGSLSYHDHGTKSAKGKSSLELEADSYYFEPSFIQGDPGKTVQLEVKNDAGVTHNLSIASQQLGATIVPPSA